MAKPPPVRLASLPVPENTEPDVTSPGECISCPGGCPVALCVCGHQYHGHASLDMGPRRCLNCTGRCAKYQAAS